MAEQPGFLAQIIDNAIQEGVNVLKKGQTAIANEVVKSIEHLVPGLDNLSNEDAKAQFSKKAGRISGIMKDLATDANVQNMFIETGEAFSKLTSDLMDAFGPGISQLTDKGTELVSDLMESTGRALAKSGVDAIMSVIGEIPALGGIVDLVVTAFVVFNGIARNIKVAARNLTQMGTIANQLTGDVLVVGGDSVAVVHDLRKTSAAIKHDINKKLDKLDKERAPGVGQDPVPAPDPSPDSALTGGSRQQSGGSATADDSTTDSSPTADDSSADNRTDSPSDHHYGDKRPYCPWYGPCSIDKLIQEHDKIKLQQIVANQRLMQTLETHQHQQLQTTLANQEHQKLEQQELKLQQILENQEHQKLEEQKVQLQQKVAVQKHMKLEHEDIQLQQKAADQQHDKLQQTLANLKNQQHDKLDHEDIKLQQIVANQQQYKLETTKFILLQKLKLILQQTLADQEQHQLKQQKLKLQQELTTLLSKNN
jgi:hypothetical protein